MSGISKVDSRTTAIRYLSRGQEEPTGGQQSFWDKFEFSGERIIRLPFQERFAPISKDDVEGYLEQGRQVRVVSPDTSVHQPLDQREDLVELIGLYGDRVPSDSNSMAPLRKLAATGIRFFDDERGQELGLFGAHNVLAHPESTPGGKVFVKVAEQWLRLKTCRVAKGLAEYLEDEKHPVRRLELKADFFDDRDVKIHPYQAWRAEECQVGRDGEIWFSHLPSEEEWSRFEQCFESTQDVKLSRFLLEANHEELEISSVKALVSEAPTDLKRGALLYGLGQLENPAFKLLRVALKDSDTELVEFTPFLKEDTEVGSVLHRFGAQIQTPALVRELRSSLEQRRETWVKEMLTLDAPDEILAPLFANAVNSKSYSETLERTIPDWRHQEAEPEELWAPLNVYLKKRPRGSAQALVARFVESAPPKPAALLGIVESLLKGPVPESRTQRLLFLAEGLPSEDACHLLSWGWRGTSDALRGDRIYRCAHRSGYFEGINAILKAHLSHHRDLKAGFVEALDALLQDSPTDAFNYLSEFGSELFPEIDQRLRALFYPTEVESEFAETTTEAVLFREMLRRESDSDAILGAGRALKSVAVEEVGDYVTLHYQRLSMLATDHKVASEVLKFLDGETHLLNDDASAVALIDAAESALQADEPSALWSLVVRLAGRVDNPEDHNEMVLKLLDQLEGSTKHRLWAASIAAVGRTLSDDPELCRTFLEKVVKAPVIHDPLKLATSFRPALLTLDDDELRWNACAETIRELAGEDQALDEAWEKLSDENVSYGAGADFTIAVLDRLELQQRQRNAAQVEMAEDSVNIGDFSLDIQE